MAFNFLGTIDSIEDFEEFEEFVLKEATLIDKRIKHLLLELDNFAEVKGNFEIADSNLRAPFSKTDISDKDYIKSPDARRPRLINIPDAQTGIDVDRLKKMFLDSIKEKRERNEFAIKKILDLTGQISREIANLEEEKENYLSLLDNIRSKFKLEQFAEVSEVSNKDIDHIRLTPQDFGLERSESTLKYMVTSIQEKSNMIVFERAAPPVKKGDTLSLENGKNNGVKTVIGLKSKNAIIVAEPLVQETPSQSFAVFKR